MGHGGGRRHRQPGYEQYDRPGKLRVLDYELNVAKMARSRIAETFRPDRSIPEAAAAVDAIDALVAIGEARLAALRASCEQEGHIWGEPELGSIYLCLVCGTREEASASDD